MAIYISSASREELIAMTSKLNGIQSPTNTIIFHIHTTKSGICTIATKTMRLFAIWKSITWWSWKRSLSNSICLRWRLTNTVLVLYWAPCLKEAINISFRSILTAIWSLKGSWEKDLIISLILISRGLVISRKLSKFTMNSLK